MNKLLRYFLPLLSWMIFGGLQAQTNQDSTTTDNLETLQTNIDRGREELGRLDTVRQKIQRAIEAGNFIQRLDELAWIEFPVVIPDTISNVPIAIVFDNLQLHPDYAQMECYVSVKIPQRSVTAMTTEGSGEDGRLELIFGSPDIKFSRNGGLVGDATVGLLGDFPIGTTDPAKFAFILNSYQRQPDAPDGSRREEGTFVTIDCDGFVAFGLDADVLFSREWIVPVDDAGAVVPNRRVQGNISATVDDWNNMLVGLTLPDFTLTSFPDVSFNLTNAIFDFSDYRNDASVVFPPGYAQAYLPPGREALWRGVYIEELSVGLPRSFDGCADGGGEPPGGNSQGTGMLLLDKTGSYSYQRPLDLPAGDPGHGPSAPPAISVIPPAPAPRRPPPDSAQAAPSAPPPYLAAPANNCRTEVGVYHLLIDGHGVSGKFFATNVLDEGKMERWKFTVDSLRLDLIASKVTGFGFGGQVQMSINKEQEDFRYSAFLSIPDRTYNFGVMLESSVNFPVFKMAEVQLDSASRINVGLHEGKFRANATLYGHAAVSAKLGSKDDDADLPPEDRTFTAARLNFQGLYLATYGRKLGLADGGYFEFELSPKLLGFPLPVSDPTLSETDEGLALGISARLNLLNQSDNGFGAQTDVAMKTKQAAQDGYDRLKSDGLTVSDITVEVNLTKFAMRGRARIFDGDPTYGKGFQGELQVRVGEEASPVFLLDMNAMFGQTDFKYWYVDAMVESDQIGIPLIPGVADINGFGGGAYYHMKMASADLIGGGGDDAGLGTTSTGLTYVPDVQTVLGLKASIALVSPSPGPETLDGVATVEVRFVESANSSVTLAEFMFYGRVEIVSPAQDQVVSGGLSGQQPDRVAGLTKSENEQRAEDDAASQNPSNAIVAAAFIRLNFEQGFLFQGTFEAYVDAGNGTVQGGGAIDILVDTDPGLWHLYIGGYEGGAIRTGAGAPLYPVSVSLDLGEDIEAVAKAYFLTGNDIPGPPPPGHNGAVCGASPTSNRGALGGQAAQGTGFAFGASVSAYIDKYISDKPRTDGRYNRNHIRGEFGVGFDISLLKYQRNTRCSIDTQQSPHGHKGWRATGRLWIYANLHIKKGGFGGNMGVGLLVEADVPNPAYLYVQACLRVGPFNIKPKVRVGEECGPPRVI